MIIQGAQEPWVLVCHLLWRASFPMHRLCATRRRQYSNEYPRADQTIWIACQGDRQPQQSIARTVKQWQDMQYEGRHSHSYMDSLPDFVMLAESYRHAGIKISKPSELKSG